MSNFRDRLLDSHSDYVDDSRRPTQSASSTRDWRSSSINSASSSPPVRPLQGYTDDEDERDDDDDGEEKETNEEEEAEEEEEGDIRDTERGEEASTGRGALPLSLSSSTSNSSSFPGEPHKAPKRRRYTCCGTTKGCLMSHPQWVTSVLLIITGVVVLILLIVFLAVVPAIIKADIASSSISINQVMISDPDSVARTLHLNTTMIIGGVGSFSALLHEMTVSISHLQSDGSYSASMGSVQVPSITLNGDTEVHIDSQLTVGDSAAFDSFVQSLMQDKTVTWHLSASASITPQLGSLSLPTYSSISFEKDVSVQGCAGLSQTWVESFSLASSNATNANVDLRIAVFNPSSFSISSLGTLHFIINFQGQAIGDIYTYNAPLLPGNNSLHMQGSLVPTTSNAEHNLIELFLTGQAATVIASAASDASSIPLFNAGMQGLQLTTIVPGNDVNLVQSMTFESLQLTPSASGLTASIDAGLLVSINSPLGPASPLFLRTMAVDSVLMYQGQPMGDLVSASVPVTAVLPFPNSTLTNTFRTNLTGTLLLIGDGSVYESFVQSLVPSTSLTLQVSGTTNITGQYVLGNLSVSTVPITAESVLPGLKSLVPVQEQGLNITGALQCHTPPCGLNVSMLASLYNPAFVTVTLERSGLRLFYKGDLLGRMEATVLDLRPGENVVSLTGELWPNADTATVSDFIDKFIHADPVVVQLVGDSSSEINGSASALTTAALHLNASVKGQDCAASLIESLALSNFSIDFRNASVFVTSSVAASFALPSNLVIPDLSISSIDMQATVWLNSTHPMGELSVRNLPVAFRHQSHPPDLLNVTLTQAELSVEVKDIAGFTAFADALLLSSSASFTLSAAAAATADTPLGALTLSAIPANSAVAFSGLNRFLSSSGESLISILSYDITHASPSHLLVTTVISINNPSNVSLHSLGTLTLDLVFNSSKIGLVTLPNFTLPRGVLNHTAIANISQPIDGAQFSLDSFIAAMINRTSSTVTLHGGLQQSNGSVIPGTDITLLMPTIRSFVTPSTFPGLSSPFLEFFNAELAILNVAITKKMPTTIQVHNPFSAYLALREVNISVWLTDKPGIEIGYWNQSLTDREIIFAPHSEQSSPIVNISVVLTIKTFLDEVEELIKDFQYLQVNSEGWIRTNIRNTEEDRGEGFDQLVRIDARNVRCYIKIKLGEEESQKEEQVRVESILEVSGG